MDTKAFDRIFIIMLENEIEQNVLKNAFMKSLSRSKFHNNGTEGAVISET